MARPKNRPKRTPIGSRNLLTVPERKGYKRRFVNDDPGRIEAFKAAGYEPVTDDVQVGDPRAGVDSQVGSIVERSVGAGKRAVLMEVPIEYYEEDQKAKEANLRQKEEALNEPGENFTGKGANISHSLEQSKPNNEGD